MRGAMADADSASPWQALKPGARVGTSSARRHFELLRQRPDLRIDPLRGNVDTRLKRLANGDFDAIMLAVAGLKRLGKLGALEGITLAALDEHDFVPSGGQAALAIETLCEGMAGGATELNDAIAALDDLPARAEVTAERAFLATIGASCVSPVGVKGTFINGHLRLRALLFSVDGRRHMAETHDAPMTAANHAIAALARECGETLGRRMLAAGAGALISAD
jgi:hydroxymethylbilane synthase